MGSLFRSSRLFISTLSLLLAVPSQGVDAVEPLTVQASIETRRLLGYGDAEVITRCDSSRRYVIPVIRADLQVDRQFLELYVSSTVSLEAALPARLLTTLSTTARRDDRIGVLALTHPAQAPHIHCLDDHRIAMVWNDGTAPSQILAIDLDTGQARPLTDHPRSVRGFAASRDGRHLLYAALPALRHDAERAAAESGFIIPAGHLGLLLQGRTEMWNPWRDEKLFVGSAAGESRPLPIRTEVSGPRLHEIASFSPTAPLVMLRGRLNDNTPPRLSGLRGPERDDYLLLVDAGTGAVRQLLERPLLRQSRYIWRPDGRSILAGPVHAALNEEHVWVEIDIASGRTHVVATGEAEPQPPVARAADLFFSVQADLNDPPVIVARDGATGQSRPVLELNPNLRRVYALGLVERIGWRDANGHLWSGNLLRPVGYRPGRRYPLVIQLGGLYGGPFSLNGSDALSVFAAQVLANRGIVVLHLPPDTRPDIVNRPQEADHQLNGIESAVHHLSEIGLVDAERVGLAGFSRTTWYVQHALAFSEIVFAAAIVADGGGYGGYMEAAFGRGFEPWGDPAARMAGPPPFGAGLEAWLERSPSFAVERIRTPLRIESTSTGAAYLPENWELFTRLAYLGHPVEMIAGPEVWLGRGDHPPQAPIQQYFTQQGEVDWFDFWLNGVERQQPNSAGRETRASLRAQYARWRILRGQRDALRSQARPPLLDWSVRPRSNTETVPFGTTPLMPARDP